MKSFLVIVDQTPECMKALRFAARRAKSIGASVSMLYVIEPGDFQHWQMVAETMRAEAYEKAEHRLNALVDEVKALTGLTPRYEIREGARRDCVERFVEETDDVGALVLGASAGGEGPGPLVAALAGQFSGKFPVPITVVPGGMTNEEIDAVS